MVYKKKYSKYDRYSKRAYNSLAVASKALSVAYGVKKLLNVEFKFHDVQLTNETIPIIPLITQISNIALGDTDVTRDGSQIKAVRLNIKWTVQVNATAATQNRMRIMVVQDKQTNGAIYTDTDLLQDVSAQDGIVSMNNLDNKFRFRVLFDRRIAVSSDGTATKFVSFNKKLQMKIRFDADAAAITSLTSNSISVLMLSNHATLTPSVTMFSRLRYVDN